MHPLLRDGRASLDKCVLDGLASHFASITNTAGANTVDLVLCVDNGGNGASKAKSVTDTLRTSGDLVQLAAAVRWWWWWRGRGAGARARAGASRLSKTRGVLADGVANLSTDVSCAGRLGGAGLGAGRVLSAIDRVGGAGESARERGGLGASARGVGDGLHAIGDVAELALGVANRAVAGALATLIADGAGLDVLGSVADTLVDIVDYIVAHCRSTVSRLYCGVHWIRLSAITYGQQRRSPGGGRL